MGGVLGSKVKQQLKSGGEHYINRSGMVCSSPNTARLITSKRMKWAVGGM
jgi:hypothetical protein